MNDDAEDITNELHSPYALLLTPAQREKRIFTECIGVVPAKHPPKIKSELFSLLQSAREGKIMHTFLCEGARFLQQQGWPLFPWSRSLFLIGIPFWAYFAGSFPYRSCSQVYPKRREQVIHLFIQTWLSRNPCLAPSAYLMPSPYMPSASGAPSVFMPSASKIPSVLLFRRSGFFLSSYRQP